MYKGVIDTLLKVDSDYDGPKKKWKLLECTMDILSKIPDRLKQAYSVEIRTVIRGLPTSTDDCQIAKQFMDRCTTRK